MTIIRPVKLAQLTLAGLATLFAGTAAQAQTSTCGMSGQGAIGSAATYDPFNPTGLAATTVRLRLTRFNPAGGSRTEHMRFILRAQSSDANNTIITPIALVSGSAAIEAPLVNIFHNFGASTPVLTGSPSAGNRFAHIQFTGNNAASDTIEVNFSVQFPGNLNLAASQNLAFDLEYTCTAQPGGATGGGVLANQIVFPITVLSGLQASYVGQSLNFGEVGRTADVDAGQIPARSGDIRVASSGPYTIALTSQNRYRMTLSGNNAPADPAQDLDYELSFLGMTRSKVNADTPLSKTCVRAGLGSPPLSGGRLLPIQAKLLEGGAEEVPATTYKDILTVTVTPLAATAPGEVC